MANGLIDEIGGLRKAAAVALEAAGQPPDTPYTFMTISGDGNGFDGMLGDLEASLSAFRQAARMISRISDWVDAGSAAADRPMIIADPATTPLP
jgi:ClpP class serine protease